MSRPIIILLGLIAFALLCWWSVTIHHGTSIPTDVVSRTQAALNAAGHGDVGVAVDGRDITLTGAVASNAVREQAGEIAAETYGVRVVDNQLKVVQPVVAAPEPEPEPVAEPAYQVLVDHQAGALTLSGTVASEVERDAIEQEVSQLFPGASVDNQLLTGALSGLAGSSALLTTGAQQLSELISGQLELGENVFRVSGVAATEARKASVEQALAGAMEEISGFGLGTSITVAEVFDDTTCQDELNSLIATEKILFAHAQADIDPVSFGLLDQLSEISGRCAAVIEIGGHTSSSGDDAYNQDLSERRAQAVKQYLIDKAVPGDRLQAVGYGEAQPIDDNATATGRANNRRIEFRVLEGS